VKSISSAAPYYAIFSNNVSVFPSSAPTYCAHWSQTSSVYVTVKFHTHMTLQEKTMILYILMCVI